MHPARVTGLAEDTDWRSVYRPDGCFWPIPRGSVHCRLSTCVLPSSAATHVLACFFPASADRPPSGGRKYIDCMNVTERQCCIPGEDGCKDRDRNRDTQGADTRRVDEGALRV